MSLRAEKHQTISNSTFFFYFAFRFIVQTYMFLSFLYYKRFLFFTLDTLKIFVQTYEL